MMKESDLNQRIANRVRELRRARGISLDALAGQTGVSRSMISLIERGESSPTAVVLDKLAAGLNVTLASLFDPPQSGKKASTGPISRRADQAEWKDPATGYVRRNISAANVAMPMQIVEVQFPAGGRVAFEGSFRELRVAQQIWVLEGSIEVTVGNDHHRLQQGDCLSMQLDGPTMFHNPTRKPARYIVVSASELTRRKR
jgi:transcriptional regulator with XRE-family HTH domain